MRKRSHGFGITSSGEALTNAGPGWERETKRGTDSVTSGRPFARIESLFSSPTADGQNPIAAILATTRPAAILLIFGRARDSRICATWSLRDAPEKASDILMQNSRRQMWPALSPPEASSRALCWRSNSAFTSNPSIKSGGAEPGVTSREVNAYSAAVRCRRTACETVSATNLARLCSADFLAWAAPLARRPSKASSQSRSAARTRIRSSSVSRS